MRASLVVLSAVAALAVAPAARADEFNCPANIESDLTPAGHPQSFKFRYVSFFDGDPAEMADLAPDDGSNPKVLEQRWSFTRAPGRPIVMVCRYHGTEATVRKEVPPEIQECRLEGFIDEQGEIHGSPTLTCK